MFPPVLDPGGPLFGQETPLKWWFSRLNLIDNYCDFVNNIISIRYMFRDELWTNKNGYKIL